ncbi:MAG: SCO family protein [Myxococcales bacterium]|nr:SCO family protein [Myxococcales bacterium]USN50223.1 MAG: SCO family protein [Myxococcales bacterium]
MKIKKVLKSPYLWAFIIGIFSLHIVREMAMRRRNAPDPMVLVPTWQLIDQNGQARGQKDSLGKVVIADFFFTSCPTICPKLTEAMKEVYARFEDKNEQVEFLSITVDPETDSPEVLKKFMERSGIDYPNWHCLTGSKKEIYDVVVEKMRVHLGEREYLPNAPGVYDIPHMAHLALFDQRGALRGLFKTEPVEMAALVRAANFLLEKPDA